jgi:hypothetical protein
MKPTRKRNTIRNNLTGKQMKTEANRTENLLQGIIIVRHHSHHRALWFVSVLSN